MLGFLEAMMHSLLVCAEANSDKMEKTAKKMVGEEKRGVVKDMMDGGGMTISYLFMTSVYLNDKEKFLYDMSFIDEL